MRNPTGLAWTTLKDQQHMIDAKPGAATLARSGFAEYDSTATQDAALALAATDRQRLIAAGHQQLRWIDDPESADLAAWMATLRAHGYGCGFARREQGSIIVQVWALPPAEAVKAVRARLGLTQGEFADAVNRIAPGLNTIQKDVSRWESGDRNPHAATLALIRGMRPMTGDGA